MSGKENISNISLIIKKFTNLYYFGIKAFVIPLTANVRQTNQRVSIEGENAMLVPWIATQVCLSIMLSLLFYSIDFFYSIQDKLPLELFEHENIIVRANSD